MKGKIAFVLGAAVGYVLGSRAGRERYEQIKRGAQTVWNTEPVQQGVSVVQGVVSDGLNTAKSAAVQTGRDFLASLLKEQPKQSPAAASPRASTPSNTSPPENTAKTQNTAKSQDGVDA